MKEHGKPKIKICAAQTTIIPLNRERNLKGAELLMERAHEEACDIICFPEYFLTGPPDKESLKFAEEIPGRLTEKLCALAKKYGLHVVMGTIIEVDDGHYYNTSTLIDDTGKIIGKYRKVKLWADERSYIDSGDELPIFRTKFGKIGLTICWDLAFPEITKELALKGAEIVFCPSFWLLEDKYGFLKSAAEKRKIPSTDTESVFVDACAPARAIENEVVFVFVNACGKFRGKNFIGRTQIAAPFAGRVAWAEENKEKLVIGEMDLYFTKLAEETYKIKRDSARPRRWAGY